jgi:hypothetical protein
MNNIVRKKKQLNCHEKPPKKTEGVFWSLVIIIFLKCVLLRNISK